MAAIDDCAAFVARFWPENEWITAVAVVGGESDWDDHSHYENERTGDDSYGWFQINTKGDLWPELKTRYGLTSKEQLFDPELNTRIAYDKWEERGWQPWGAYKDGGYKKYGRYEKAQAAVERYEPGKPPMTDRPAYTNSPNRSSGLGVPQGIVIHRTYGGYEGAKSWLLNPSADASAHDIFGQRGQAAQLVPWPDPDDFGPRDGRYKAWHCKDGNTHYLGFEHEGSDDDPPSDAMLRASAREAARACKLYGIPVRFGPSGLNFREWFKGFGAHANVPGNDHTDGNPWPWQKYLGMVEGFMNEEEDWLTMATEEEVRKIVREEIERVVGKPYVPGGTVLKALYRGYKDDAGNQKYNEEIHDVFLATARIEAKLDEK